MNGFVADVGEALLLLRVVLKDIQDDGHLRHLDIERVAPDDDLDALGIDSVARLEIMLSLEEKMSVELVPDPDSRVDRVSDVLDLIVAGGARP